MCKAREKRAKSQKARVQNPHRATAETAGKGAGGGGEGGGRPKVVLEAPGPQRLGTRGKGEGVEGWGGPEPCLSQARGPFPGHVRAQTAPATCRLSSSEFETSRNLDAQEYHSYCTSQDLWRTVEDCGGPWRGPIEITVQPVRAPRRRCRSRAPPLPLLPLPPPPPCPASYIVVSHPHPHPHPF